MRIRLLSKLLMTCLVSLTFQELAVAQPARIIIARHGEKLDPYMLCEMGTQRSQALAEQYLGRGASQSLCGVKGPDAIFAIGLHPIETNSNALKATSREAYGSNLITNEGELVDQPELF